MGFMGRIFKISDLDGVANEMVLEKADVNIALLLAIIIRQLNFLEHIILKEDLECSVFKGFIQGKRVRGRQRETFTG